MEAKKYDAESIKILEGLEGVRRRPSMYIGSTSKDGLHHMVYEIVDNSVDEALAEYCKNIYVTINKDGSVTIIDDGRGIPVEINKQYKKSALEIVFTKLHQLGIPCTVAMGGGYSPDIRNIVDAHCNTFRVAKEIYT